MIDSSFKTLPVWRRRRCGALNKIVDRAMIGLIQDGICPTWWSRQEIRESLERLSMSGDLDEIDGVYYHKGNEIWTK